jgi:hypothetical protein
MKRLLALPLVIAFTAGIVHADLTLTWGAVDGSLLYDSNNTPLTGGQYTIQLIADTDNNTQLGGSGGMIDEQRFGVGSESQWGGLFDPGQVANDQIVLTASWQLDGGQYYMGDNSLGFWLQEVDSVGAEHANSQFYLRWFNDDASEVGIIYGTGGTGGMSGWQFAASPPPTPQKSIEFSYGSAGATGSAYAGTSGWQTIQPIPEPGTIGLFLIGAGVLAYRKRRQPQQALEA